MEDSPRLVAPRPDARDDARRLTALVADDEADSRLLLVRLLRHHGFEVFEARDGNQAILEYEARQPDLVLLDVQMPGSNGYETCRRLKALTKDRFVPVIFVTGLAASRDLVAGIEAGGDDFISKPVNLAVLGAKIEALDRIRRLHDVLRDQRQTLASQRAQLLLDQQIARETFTRLLQPSQQDNSNVFVQILPAEGFHGDLVLAEWTPQGSQHVLVGDFVGHGLRAALGASPVAQCFRAMTKLGFSLPAIVVEVNRRMLETLPPGLFLAACLLDIDLQGRQLGIWNGGLPDVFLLRDGQVARRYPSVRVPLGVTTGPEFETEPEHAGIEAGDRIFVCSDGVTERARPDGEMFGADRLARVLAEAGAALGPLYGLRSGLLAPVQVAVDDFAAGQPAADDCTLVEIVCDEDARPGRDTEAARLLRQPAPWRLSLDLDEAALRMVDPLPTFAQMLADIEGLDGHRQSLLTILSELFANAVEHGLLRLDSRIKDGRAGFSTYYEMRYRALQRLVRGRVCLALTHEPLSSGGRITIRVEDSGPGFDVAVTLGTMRDTAPHGRGIALVRALCADVRYLGCGNIVEAAYEWKWADGNGSH